MSKDNFTSKIGIVAATAGSAVGLGNLWGFSYKAGTNGGGSFVLFYLFSAIFIGMPVLLAEFIIGREGRKGPVGSVEEITGKKSPFVIAGYLGVLSTFLILSFYSVIAGWSIDYLLNSLTHGFSQYATMDTAAHFGEVSNQLGTQIFFQCLFVLATIAIVIFGIQRGIEKISKIMMPLLFGIIVILVIYSLTLPGLGEAVSFLFKPSPLPEGATYFSTFSSALGQAFFSLSVGMGAVVTYAKAVDDKEDLNSITLQVVFFDTLIALAAGLAIFPIIFSYGMTPDQGAGLAFISLPIAFAEMPFGYIIGNLFFFLLVIAALTSAISMLENSLSVILDKFNIERKVATIGLGALVMLFACLSQTGLNFSCPLLNFTGGTAFMDQLDYLTSLYFIPIGALIFALIVGYRMDTEVVKKQINNEKISKIYIPYVRYVVPILIAIIIVTGIL